MSTILPPEANRPGTPGERSVLADRATNAVLADSLGDFAVVDDTTTAAPADDASDLGLVGYAPTLTLSEPPTELARTRPDDGSIVAKPAANWPVAEPVAGAGLTVAGEDPRGMMGLGSPGRLRSAAALSQLGPRVSVVMPALNEAENLPYVLCRLPVGLHEVIVVDGRSTDGTVETARRLRPDVRLVCQTGRGKGNALAAGFAACTGDVVVTLDADGSTDPAEIPRFVAALCNGADFAKGSRFAQGGGSSDITRIRRFGNRALSAIVNNIYGTSYTDLCYGYNAFWRRCLPYMRIDCDGFEVETLINVRIAKAGLVVHEVPSYEQDRIFGASNLNAIRDGIRVLSTIGIERIAAARPRSRLPVIARRLMT